MAVFLAQQVNFTNRWITAVVFWLILGWGLLFHCPVHAQTPIQLDSLPTTGISLLDGWRWHPGDNAAWASPTFDARRWDTIHPNHSLNRLAHFKTKPLGWFRLSFVVDSAPLQQSLAATISQVGASEIYIDGKLWQRLGTVGSTSSQQKAYSPADKDIYVIPRLLAGRHVLAVRLSQQPLPWYVPDHFYANRPVFKLTLFDVQSVIREQFHQTYIHAFGNYLLVGIFLMLSIIHFMYYRYRRRRVNLAFGVTMLLEAGCIILLESMGLITDPVVGEWLMIGQGVLFPLFMLMLLITYYIYLGQPLSWFLVVEGLLLLGSRFLSYLINDGQSLILPTVAMFGLLADGIRVCIKAMREGRTNARFMLVSILVMIAILLIGTVVGEWVNDYPVYKDLAIAVINLLFFLTLPISFAIILAREHAQTNRHLEDKLAEVAQLSREKESILTQQNETLEQQVTERTAELTQSLINLRETQQQLIQREKMAGLGELTAGIAHEIQNPLNFVNNFAEVSDELVQELKQERQKSEPDQELEAEILDDLAQNLQKIEYHGKRASSIVKNMLEHSRTSSGQRELTDINALADEYLRLSYHGLRAKDKSFNAQLITQFDPALCKLNVVAQDIGRVLLNLFNNAFYAVQECQRTASAEYKPAVSVCTQQGDGFAEIRISDNGTGISDAVREKIFLPFYTTKPTGQGTGLGLSLSYDIITKGHSGSLILDTTANRETAFVIRLPIRAN